MQIYRSIIKHKYVDIIMHNYTKFAKLYIIMQIYRNIIMHNYVDIIMMHNYGFKMSFVIIHNYTVIKREIENLYTACPVVLRQASHYHSIDILDPKTIWHSSSTR